MRRFLLKKVFRLNSCLNRNNNIFVSDIILQTNCFLCNYLKILKIHDSVPVSLLPFPYCPPYYPKCFSMISTQKSGEKAIKSQMNSKVISIHLNTYLLLSQTWLTITHWLTLITSLSSNHKFVIKRQIQSISEGIAYANYYGLWISYLKASPSERLIEDCINAQNE